MISESRKIPHHEYLATDGVSNSLLQQVNRSPAHAKERRDNPQPATPAMLFGTMTHSAILEPEIFIKSYTVAPKWDGRTTSGKAGKLAWDALNPDRIALHEDQFNHILGMIKSVYNHPTAARLLASGQSEMSFFRELSSGLMLKCRPDHIWENIVIDLKTTEDASLRSFARSILNFNYHMQAAFYLDLVTSIGTPVDRFIFIAIEKKPPFAVATYELDFGSLERGRELVAKNLALWIECVGSKTYPAYSTEIQSIAIPSYGFND